MSGIQDPFTTETVKSSSSLPQRLLAVNAIATQSERFVPLAAAIAIAGILSVEIPKALYKPLWLDEIMGVLIAKLPRASDIWAICKSGADNQPPLYHYAMHISVRLFGNDALGMRLPSLAGYVLFSICLYLFVARRTSRMYGLIALLFPAVTGCWNYATEARPYALILGFSALAAVCWQSIAMCTHRRPALIGLAFSLLCTYGLHYYAPLVFLPFVVAESIRTYQQRKFDVPIWLAIAAPLVILIPYFPVIRETRINSGIANAYYARPALFGSMASFADQFLTPALPAALGIACIYFLTQTLLAFLQRIKERQLPSRDLIRDAVLVLGFTSITVLGIVLSKVVTHVYFNRYVVAAMFGVIAVICIGLWLAFSGRKAPALAVTGLLVVMLLHNCVWDLRQAEADRANLPRANGWRGIPAAAFVNDLPIVAAGPNEFMDLHYYGSQALRRRLIYVSSEAAAREIIGFTFLERMMIGPAPYFGTHVVDYETFIAEHRSFYLFGAPQWWIVPKLIKDGAQLSMLQGGPTDTQGDQSSPFFLVQMPRR